MSLIRLGWSCAAGLALALVFSTAYADQVLVPERSNSRLSLEGPVSVSGSASVPLLQLPPGEYRFQTDGPGQPTARGRFFRNMNGLSSRPWAGPSSLFYPPGFVHIDRGEGRGWAFLSTGVVSGAMALFKQRPVNSAKDNLDRAQFLYDRAVTSSNIEAARVNLIVAGMEKADAEEIRNLWRGYFAMVWFGAAAEAWLLTPTPTLQSDGQGQFVVRVPRATGWKAGFRSALVPGAGQRYMGRNGKSNLFAMAFGTTAALTIFAQDSFLDARREQAEAQLRFNRAENENDIRRLAKELEDAASDTNDRNIARYALFGLTGGVYLWNIIDAFALGHQSGTSDFGLSFIPNQDGFTAEFRWGIQ